MPIIADLLSDTGANKPPTELSMVERFADQKFLNHLCEVWADIWAAPSLLAGGAAFCAPIFSEEMRFLANLATIRCKLHQQTPSAAQSNQSAQVMSNHPFLPRNLYHTSSSES